jgi:acetyltransferase-like isoleucine patch superfamily enzyme
LCVAWHFISATGARAEAIPLEVDTQSRGRVCALTPKFKLEGGGSIIPFCSIKIQYSSRVESRSTGITIVSSYGAYLSGVELYIEDNNCTIEIGANTYIGHHSHLACTEDGSTLKIGSMCMLSSYVQIRTGDSHSILDKDGSRINPAASVTIDDHCWLGEGCKVMKGVTLGSDTVVSSGAIVTKSFGSNVLLGGIPAKVLKENINWDEKRL